MMFVLATEKDRFVRRMGRVGMITETQDMKCPSCQEDLTPYREVKGKSLDFCLFCQFPLMPIAGKYQLTGLLGEGGFGVVYRAKHLTMTQDAERVVKILKPEVLAMAGVKERFLREVQMTAALSQRNEHIVRVYDDYGEIPKLGYFYVMELLEGRPLADYLQDRDALPAVPWCLNVFEQLCDAMQAAHERKIVHRDLKPENILLIKRGKNPYFVKVLDFGIAKPMDAESTGKLTKGILGTPFYMAPEQLMNQAIDHRTDIYAMGVILYEMLTGQIPLIEPEIVSSMNMLEVISRKLMTRTIPPPRRDPPRSCHPFAYLCCRLQGPLLRCQRTLPFCRRPLGRTIRRISQSGQSIARNGHKAYRGSGHKAGGGRTQDLPLRLQMRLLNTRLHRAIPNIRLHLRLLSIRLHLLLWSVRPLALNAMP